MSVDFEKVKKDGNKLLFRWSDKRMYRHKLALTVLNCSNKADFHRACNEILKSSIVANVPAPDFLTDLLSEEYTENDKKSMLHVYAAQLLKMRLGTSNVKVDLKGNEMNVNFDEIVKQGELLHNAWKDTPNKSKQLALYLLDCSGKLDYSTAINHILGACIETKLKPPSFILDILSDKLNENEKKTALLTYIAQIQGVEE